MLTPVFPDSDRLPPELLAAMTVPGQTRNFPAHAILVNEGDLADSIYIVLSGRLRVYASAESGREVVLGEEGPGDFFGELSLDGGKRSASVQALEPCVCRVVQGAELRRFMAEHPGFGVYLTAKLIRLVRRLTEQVRSLALQDVYGRVVRLLMEMSQEASGGERVLTRKITQQGVADRVGSSREMVNRVMKDLSSGGYLAVRDGLFVIQRKFPSAR